jgi:hypothetical protein
LAESREIFLSEGLINVGFFSSELGLGNLEIGLDFSSFLSDFFSFFRVFLPILFSQVFEQCFDFLGTIFEVCRFFRLAFHDKID